MGPSWGQYGSHVVNGIYIHSVASGQPNGNNLPAGEYLKLGNPASHGCIRWQMPNGFGKTAMVLQFVYLTGSTNQMNALRDLWEEIR